MDSVDNGGHDGAGTEGTHGAGVGCHPDDAFDRVSIPLPEGCAPFTTTVKELSEAGPERTSLKHLYDGVSYTLPCHHREEVGPVEPVIEELQRGTLRLNLSQVIVTDEEPIRVPEESSDAFLCGDEFVTYVEDARRALGRRRSAEERERCEKLVSEGKRAFPVRNHARSKALLLAVTETGHHVTVEMAARPGFYIEIPAEFASDRTSRQRFAEALCSKLCSGAGGSCLHGSVRAQFTRLQNLRIYSNGKHRPFLWVTFPSVAAWREAARKMRAKTTHGETLRLYMRATKRHADVPIVMEEGDHVSPETQVLHALGLRPRVWFTLKRGLTRVRTSRHSTRCDVSVEVPTVAAAGLFCEARDRVLVVDDGDVSLPPRKVAVLDTEARSHRVKAFPNAREPEDAMTSVQISYVWEGAVPPRLLAARPELRVGDVYENVVLTTMDPGKPVPGIHTLVCHDSLNDMDADDPVDAGGVGGAGGAGGAGGTGETGGRADVFGGRDMPEAQRQRLSAEREMLNRTRDEIVMSAFCTGVTFWGGWSFDNAYLSTRAHVTGARRFHYLSPVLQHRQELVQKSLDSAAKGSGNVLNLLWAPAGLDAMDMLYWDRSNASRINGHGLDAVSYAVLGAGKTPVKPPHINAAHNMQMALHEDSPVEQVEATEAMCYAVIEYGIVDCLRTAQLGMRELGYWLQAVQQSIATYTFMPQMTTRGQQATLWNLILYYCRKLGHVANGAGDSKYGSPGFQGGTVFNPVKAFHTSTQLKARAARIELRDKLRLVRARVRERLATVEGGGAGGAGSAGGAGGAGEDPSFTPRGESLRHDVNVVRVSGDVALRVVSEELSASGKEPLSVAAAAELVHVCSCDAFDVGNERLTFGGEATLRLGDDDDSNGAAATLDFASLYPNIMGEFNICYYTFVLPEMVERLRAAGYPIRGVKAAMGNGAFETFYFVQYVPEFETIDKARARAMEAREDPFVRDERGEPMWRKAVEEVKDARGKTVYRVRNTLAGKVMNRGVEGVLPQIERELYAKRKAAKRAMAAAHEAEDTLTEAIENCRQLAFKINMNSLFGFTGVHRGVYPFYPVAASITTLGGEALRRCKDYVETKYAGQAFCIYGDTDSVMVKFLNTPIVKAACLSFQMEAELSALFDRASMKVEFETLAVNFLCVASKMYAELILTEPTIECARAFAGGYPTLTVPGKGGKPRTFPTTTLKIKGLKPVRKDNCKAVRDIVRESLRVLTDPCDGGPAAALEAVQRRLDPLERDQLPPSAYLMSRKVAPDGEYSHVHPGGKLRMPPEQLVCNWQKEKAVRGSAHIPGDRVPFVYMIDQVRGNLEPPPGRDGASGFETRAKRTKNKLGEDEWCAQSRVMHAELLAIDPDSTADETVGVKRLGMCRKYLVVHQLLGALQSVFFSFKSEVARIAKNACENIDAYDAWAEQQRLESESKAEGEAGPVVSASAGAGAGAGSVTGRATSGELFMTLRRRRAKQYVPKRVRIDPKRKLQESGSIFRQSLRMSGGKVEMCRVDTRLIARGGGKTKESKAEKAEKRKRKREKEVEQRAAMAAMMRRMVQEAKKGRLEP